MKKIKFLLLTMLIAMVGVFASCSKDSKTKQEGHNQIRTARALDSLVNVCKTKNLKYVIVDDRSKSQYDAGHVPGSVWLMDGNVYNMDNNEYAKAVKTYCDEHNLAGFNTIVFLISDGSYALTTTMAGSISTYGFKMSHTYALMGGFPAWQKEYPDRIEK